MRIWVTATVFKKEIDYIPFILLAPSPMRGCVCCQSGAGGAETPLFVGRISYLVAREKDLDSRFRGNDRVESVSIRVNPGLGIDDR